MASIVYDNRYEQISIPAGARVEKLNQGTMSEVVFVKDRTKFEDEQYVLKRPTVSPGNLTSQRELQIQNHAIIKEIKALMSVNSIKGQLSCSVPEIVKSGVDSINFPPHTYHYFINTKAKGKALSNFDSPPPPLIAILNIYAKIIESLQVLHKNLIVFNDIRHEHLFWDENVDPIGNDKSSITLIDFGNAYFLPGSNLESYNFKEPFEKKTTKDDFVQLGESLYRLITGSEIESKISISNVLLKPEYKVIEEVIDLQQFSAEICSVINNLLSENADSAKTILVKWINVFEQYREFEFSKVIENMTSFNSALEIENILIKKYLLIGKPDALLVHKLGMRLRILHDDERHKINFPQMKFKAFVEMLSNAGLHPQLAIMIMDGENWQRFFDRFQRLTDAGEDNRNIELKAIHGHINSLITSKQLTEDNIQKLLGYFEQEIRHLENSTPIMKQFEAFMTSSESDNENFSVSGEEKSDSSINNTLSNQKNEKSNEIKKNKVFKISVSHPKLLSKRFESSFLFQVYATESRTQVARNIKIEFPEQLISEHVKRSSVKHYQKIIVKFFSPQFDFSEPVTKLISNSLNKIVFLGKPKDVCEPGLHKILISISDAENKQEFESLTINVQVVDFAFDHVSRPLLTRVSTVVLGVGSFAMFVLSFLEQIDKTIGLTSGTAAGVMAVIIYTNFYNLYQRVRLNMP